MRADKLSREIEKAGDEEKSVERERQAGEGLSGFGFWCVGNPVIGWLHGHCCGRSTRAPWKNLRLQFLDAQFVAFGSGIRVIF